MKREIDVRTAVVADLEKGGHSTLENTPEKITDTQRPQEPLRGTSKWWRNERDRKRKMWVQ